MKLLTFLIGFAGVAVISGALAVGCGPKKEYCPRSSTGQCIDQDTGVAPTGLGGSSGDATIIVEDA
jgi:hypothetical protein